MTTSHAFDVPAVPLDATNLHTALHDAVRELSPAIAVYAYQNDRERPIPAEWFIIEREGRVGTVSLSPWWRLGGEPDVSFAVRPSRDYGSSLAVRAQDWNEGMELRTAALIATQPAYGNPWATQNRDLPNDGVRHFDWCASHLVRVTVEPTA